MADATANPHHDRLTPHQGHLAHRIPYELVSMIMAKLPSLADACHLGLTCRRLHAIWTRCQGQLPRHILAAYPDALELLAKQYRTTTEQLDNHLHAQHIRQLHLNAQRLDRDRAFTTYIFSHTAHNHTYWAAVLAARQASPLASAFPRAYYTVWHLLLLGLFWTHVSDLHATSRDLWCLICINFLPITGGDSDPQTFTGPDAATLRVRFDAGLEKRNNQKFTLQEFVTMCEPRTPRRAELFRAMKVQHALVTLEARLRRLEEGLERLEEHMEALRETARLFHLRV